MKKYSIYASPTDTSIKQNGAINKGLHLLGIIFCVLSIVVIGIMVYNIQTTAVTVSEISRNLMTIVAFVMIGIVGLKLIIAKI